LLIQTAINTSLNKDAIFYLWFEAFPIVFNGIYHFNEGVSGLPFLGFLVSGGITVSFFSSDIWPRLSDNLQYTVYCLYQKYHMAPRVARAAAANSEAAPEIRLEIGLMASIFIPTSVLIFGFGSKATIHWSPFLLHFPWLLLIRVIIGSFPSSAPHCTSPVYSSLS
jgi:hypothetical protein